MHPVCPWSSSHANSARRSDAVDKKPAQAAYLPHLTNAAGQSKRAGMADLTACASCSSTQSLKQCARCKIVSYCSTACQRAHWQSHKPSCHFKVVVPPAAQHTDALSLLRDLPNPITEQEQEMPSKTQEALNIPELRLAIFSKLPATDQDTTSLSVLVPDFGQREEAPAEDVLHCWPGWTHLTRTQRSVKHGMIP